MTFTFADEPEPEQKKRTVPLPPNVPPQPSTQAPNQERAPKNPGPVVNSPDDAELKPGSRKDLWPCPHCGAGNRPERTDCRECGKLPSDPVVKPWHGNPIILGGIGAALLALFAALWFATRTDISFRIPGPTQVDKAPRMISEHGNPLTLPGGATFTPTHRLSVCGRVVGTRQSSAGGVSVLLALGNDASDETSFSKISMAPDNGPLAFTPSSAQVIVLHLLSQRNRPDRGVWLSVEGLRGTLERGARKLYPDTDYVVNPEQIQP